MRFEKENEWLGFIEQAACRHPEVKLGIGDDAAWLSEGENLVSCDMILEGVHFLRSEASPQQIGHKALAVSLSDLAAMGASPYAAFVSVATSEPDFLHPFWLGLSALAKEFAVAIAGGDTSRSEQGIVVNTTVLGRPHPKGVVKRSGAKPGDLICVTGSLGGSRGGKHLDFIPRVREAKHLLDHFTLHAMMDLSDGLATDLPRLCAASACGAEISLADLPVTHSLKDLPQEMQWRHALSDGEDFELLFTLPANQCEALQKGTLGCPVTVIGRITENPEVVLQGPAGITPLSTAGFEHRFFSRTR